MSQAIRLPTADEPAVLVRGDALDVLRRLPDGCVDAVVTDPPAGIAFMGKEWDDARQWQAPISSFGLADSKFRLPAPTIGDARNPMCRKCRKHKRGSKSHEWCECGVPDYDEADRRIATRERFVGFLTAVMAECLRVLKPGGHALVWAIPRTSHWTATAIEDAGFEIRDRISHLFGSGFPKSHNLTGDRDGWGTALKPACEDWWLCRKPLAGTVAGNVERYGTGALNIDGCRIETNGRPLREKTPGDSVNAGIGNLSDKISTSGRATGTTDFGRWPANVTHDGSEEVVGMFPEVESGMHDRGAKASSRWREAEGRTDSQDLGNGERGYGDTGSAARFFYCPKATQQDRDEGTPAGNRHPTVKSVELMRWLCRLVTPPGGLVLDPFCGSGSTGKAAVLEGFRFLGIDREREYLDIAAGRIHHANGGDTMFAGRPPEVVTPGGP